MSSIVNSLLVIVLLLNFLALGTSRIRAIINGASAQGVLLGLTPVMMHPDWHVQTVAISLATIGLKGIAIPQMLLKA